MRGISTCPVCKGKGTIPMEHWEIWPCPACFPSALAQAKAVLKKKWETFLKEGADDGEEKSQG